MKPEAYNFYVIKFKNVKKLGTFRRRFLNRFAPGNTFRKFVDGFKNRASLCGVFLPEKVEGDVAGDFSEENPQAVRNSWRNVVPGAKPCVGKTFFLIKFVM